MNKAVLIGIFTLLGMISFNGNADYKDTGNVTIQLVSVWTVSGDILVQTKPKHSITGLGCSSDYWLKLSKTAAGYKGTLSMLLSAQASQSKVTIRAVDDQGTDFCRLDRVITQAS